MNRWNKTVTAAIVSNATVSARDCDLDAESFEYVGSVAAFNVVSSLIMMVKDKTGDIAVLRTLGATRGNIMRIFLMCGASVGVTGTVVGTLLGVVFCLNIERIRVFLQGALGAKLFDPEVLQQSAPKPAKQRPFVAEYEYDETIVLAVNVALIGFEFLVAVLQAYVFAVLTCIYLHDAVHLH